MNNLQTPAEQLRAWRTYCRLTPAQVAQYSGIPEEVILSIEQGRAQPDVPTVERLNSFFSQYHARQQAAQSYPQSPAQSYPQSHAQSYPQSQQPYAQSQPRQSYPQQPYAQSYPQSQQPYAQSQPRQSYPQQPYAQSYPQSQQPYAQSQPQQPYAQSYPQSQQPYAQSQPQQPYAQSYPQSQQPYAPMYPQQGSPYQTQRTGRVGGTHSAELAQILLIVQAALFALPYMFLFFPFVNIAELSGLGDWGFLGVVFDINGNGLYVLPYLFTPSFSLVMLQIGIWLTTLTAGPMIVLTVLKIVGIDEKWLAPSRTILFYIYAFGALACLIGMIAAGGSMRWGLIVYTIFAFVAAGFRVYADGGVESLKVVLRKH